VLGLALAQAGTPSPASDDLEAAKQLYRDGHFSESIVKLRTVLAELPLLQDLALRRVQLADAYLHLALAHVALAEREPAKQAFKDMLKVDSQRKLDPEIYAPKVVALFGEARDELEREPKPAAAAAPNGPVRSPSHKGRTVALLVGAGAAAAGGVALAAAQSTPPPTTVPFLAFTPVASSGQATIVWLTADPQPGSRLALRGN